jgi:uncharacterized membrane protein YjgN (DUF898 family)
MESNPVEPPPPLEKADTSSPAAEPPRHRLVFSGSGGEYFRIWIVNLLLTIISLGIYGAWAKVRRLRYFYGHTVLAGSSFEYHGQPLQILKGRLIALAMILPYYLLQYWRPLWSLAFLVIFIVALPFIIVRSQRFHLRMSSWRNVRFNFAGGYGRAAAAYLGWGLLAVLSLGLLAPYADYQRQRFKIANSRFGGARFDYAARPGEFFVVYLAAFCQAILVVLALILVVVLVSLIVGANGLALSPAHWQEIFSSPGNAGFKSAIVAGLVFFYVVYIMALFVPYAYVKARTTNEALNHTTLREHGIRSTLSARGLLGILVSNFLLVLITVGLFAPWAKVRLVRYQLERTSLLAKGSLDDFINEPEVRTGAAAQELSDFMDLDFGL